MRQKESTQMEQTNERITSPEKLDGYLRVVRPSMWIAFAAVFTVVAAIFIWACMDELTISIKHVGFVMNHEAFFSLSENQGELVHVGDEFTMDGKKAVIKDISNNPQESFSEGSQNEEAEEPSDSVYRVTADTDLPDGVYEAVIRVEGVKPISFLFG